MSRQQKESIALVCSAARLSTYCVTIHCEMMRTMGVTDPELEQVAVDHHYADISEADKALLDFALKLTERLPETDGKDIEALRQHGRAECRTAATRGSLLHGDGDGVSRHVVDDDFDLLRARRHAQRHLYIHLVEPHKSWG